MAELMAESPESKPEDGKRKRSALLRRLKDDAELSRLKDFAIQRRIEMRSELSTWRVKRERYQKILNDDFSYRQTNDKKHPTIFDLSNESFNMTKSIHRFMKGRMAEDIFGSEPYFSAVPQGPSDLGLSEQIQRYGGFKVRQAELPRWGREGIDVALGNGEVPIKVNWCTRRQTFDRHAVILKESEGGKEVLTDTGEYIYEDDEEVVLVDEEGAEFRTYAKAPTLRVQPNWVFEEDLIEDEVVSYEGLEYTIIDFKDLAFPEKCTDLEKNADCVCHDYDAPLLYLKQKYGEHVTEDVWANLARSSGSPQSQANQPKQEVGEQQSSQSGLDETNPSILVSEIYFRFDVFKDGNPRELYMVVAVEQQEILYCDYLANVTPNGVRPIFFWTVNRVPGRAYGRGFCEIYEKAQSVIDILMNCVIYRNENNADPIKIINTSAFNETVDEKTIKHRLDKWLTMRNGQADVRAAIQFLEIPDLDERTQWLIETFVQWMQNDSGVSAAMQGDVQAVPQNGTATGTNAIMAAGSVLHLLTLNEIKEGIERTVGFSLALLFWKQNQEETFNFLEGQGEQVMALKDIRALRLLPINVQLIMTRLKMREQREAAVAAIPIANGFAMLPPEVQARQKSIYVQAFKGLGIENADTIFEPIVLAPPPGEILEEAGKITEELPVSPQKPLNVVAA